MLLRRTAAFAAAAVLTLTAAVPVQAAENPYRRGPAPTLAALEAPSGPYRVDTVAVPADTGRGFRGGTLYHPAETGHGRFGGVVLVPGYAAGQATLAWLGARLASHGFIAFTIDTLGEYDEPPARGEQALAALDFLPGHPAVRERLDAARLAVAGHSMGGGGVLEAIGKRPGLRAAISLTPWHTTKNWSQVRVPTLVVAAERDDVARIGKHARPIYQSFPSTMDRAYLELARGRHNDPIRANTAIARFGIAWLKRFVDNDSRYEQFLCPAPLGRGVKEYRDSCPHRAVAS